MSRRTGSTLSPLGRSMNLFARTPQPAKLFSSAHIFWIKLRNFAPRLQSWPKASSLLMVLWTNSAHVLPAIAPSRRSFSRLPAIAVTFTSHDRLPANQHVAHGLVDRSPFYAATAQYLAERAIWPQKEPGSYAEPGG